jgi:uncharacterized protein (TIGR00369 family)
MRNVTGRSFTLQALNDFVDSIPFLRSLGIRVTERRRDGVTLRCDLRPEFRNAAGVLHGGVTATLADAAVGIAIANHFRLARRATTVEMKINYLLPVSDGPVTARARLLRVGSTLSAGSVDLFDRQRRLVAAALLTYMLLPNPDKAPGPV